jgi:hypothetical protein
MVLHYHLYGDIHVERQRGRPVRVSIAGIPDAAVHLGFIADLYNQRALAAQEQQPADTTTEPVPPLFEARTSLRKLAFTLILGVTFFAFAIWATVIAIDPCAYYDDWEDCGQDSPNRALAIIPVAVIYLAGLWPLVSVATTFRNRMRIITDTNGLHVFSRQGHQYWPWIAISEYCQKTTWRVVEPMSFSALFLYSGDQVILRANLTKLDSSAGLLATINEHASKTLLPSARQRFNAGETLDFNTVSLNQQGITHKGKTIPWSDIRSWDIPAQTNTIVFVGDNSKARLIVNILGIANVQVLLSLVSEQIKMDANDPENQPL